MAEQATRRVLIVGAGAMGLISGHVLALAGAEVTFLVRPHRAEALKRPQILYCYNDNQLKTLKDYRYITDPSKIADTDFEYILVTLDGTALSNEVGQALVKTIGETIRGKQTKVVLASVMLDVRSWFLNTSGLNADQVTAGGFVIHAYQTKMVTLPLHPPADATLLAQADLAYADSLGPGIMVDDSAPAVAKGFAGLWNASGVSTCAVLPVEEGIPSFLPFFAVFAASELMDWPRFAGISKGDYWSKATAAVKEIYGLGVCGVSGQQKAAGTTEAVLEMTFAGMEKALLPLDMQAFNRFHHGGKVNHQDRALLRGCLAMGAAEGKDMPALRDLVDRVEAKRAVAA